VRVDLQVLPASRSQRALVAVLHAPVQVALEPAVWITQHRQQRHAVDRKCFRRFAAAGVEQRVVSNSGMSLERPEIGAAKRVDPL
jgi:hypothetical protein